MKNKCVFFDRDGVINIEKNYTHQIKDFDFLPDVFKCMKQFQSAGYLIVIITNQAGIGRGYYTEEQFHTLTNWMVGQFKRNGIHINKVYFCPHHPVYGQKKYKKACNCRKPKPGMILQAKEDLAIDLSKSILIGDKTSDISAGKAAGVGRNFLVETGHKVTDDNKKQAGESFPNLTSVCSAIFQEVNSTND